MHTISNDKTVRINTVQGLKDSNSQPLATQAKQDEKLVYMMLAIKKSFDLMVDDIVDYPQKTNL